MTIPSYRPADLLRIAGLACLYALIATSVLSFFSSNGVVSVVWPPSGLALAALLIGGSKYWPGIYAGALISNLMAGSPLWVCALIAIGNTLEPLVGCWLLRGKQFNPGLPRLSDFFRLVFNAALVSPLVSASIGTLTLLLSGFIQPPQLVENLLHWWMGDALGVVLLTPLILIWRDFPGDCKLMGQRKEGMALFVLFFLTGQAVFLGWFREILGTLALEYWIFLFVAWSAVRFGRHSVTLLLAITTVQALLGAAKGVGYFGNSIAQTQLTDFWFFMFTLALVGMAQATAIKEHRQSEEDLTDSRATLSDILETALDGYWLVDMRGHLIDVNSAATSMLGYTKQEMLDLRVTDIDVSETPENVRMRAEKMRMTGGDRFESRHRRKDGSEIDVEVSISYLQAENVFSAFIREITQRKRAETEMFASRERLNETQRIAKVGSWSRNLISGELVWTDEVLHLFETDPTQFADPYTALLAVIHPDDIDAVKQAYLHSIKAQVPYEITHRLLMSDGRIKWIHQKCSSKFDAAGQAIWSQGVVQDVTERTLAEIELRIAAVAFESREATLITDASGVILRINQAFTECTGYSAEEAIGQTPHLLNSGRHDVEFYTAMWKTLIETGTWQGEIWDRRKNGEIYPKWLTITAVKGVDGNVTHYVGTHQDITERKMTEEKIAELAFFDSLTHLPNRTLLMDRLKQAMTAGNRNGDFGALLFLDLDHFKTLNDTLGHDMGDMLLQQVAQRLTACVRASDTVARLGGDEFVVVLGSLDRNIDEAANEVKVMGEKILAALNSTYQLREIEYQNSASIGATVFRGDELPIEELLKQADLAMYASKKFGRNALHFFDPSMQLVVIERIALEERLRRAIQEQQLVLHFQAQVDGKGRVTGAEVLVRWRYPERALVLPEDFMPLAEESGLILPLGIWVLESACQQLALWACSDQTAHLTLSVNISAKQFGEADFVDKVLAAIRKSGAKPNRLKLELTERLLLNDVEESIEKMHKLKDSGVSFSLDEFGTGYSSIANLKRMPLEQMKIGQSFVRNIQHDHNSAMIARTIVAMAQNLELGVIAAGVETEIQWDILASLGCNSFQGYYFSRPVPIDGFNQLAQRVRFL